MKKIFATILFLSVLGFVARSEEAPFIEVTGSATVNIVPDRITIEVGMEEYYAPRENGDSVRVKLSTIERSVRESLYKTGVADSLIVVADMGNYRSRSGGAEFLMAKRLSATFTDFSQLERFSEILDRKGVTSFNITGIDNSEIGSYNRQGLKAALDAARDKAEFIAANEGGTLLWPVQIIENGPNYYETPAFSNVAFDSGAGMQNMRRIVRRYSVKVRYVLSVKKL